jgi:double zinc ribbon protein
VDQEERDRRDSPDAEDPSSSSAEPTQPDATEQHAPDGPEPDDLPDDAPHAPASWDTAPVDPGAAAPVEPTDTMGTAEIESWPSQDASASIADAAESPAWPTEPPAAGSADADTWPTTPPERGDEPIREPEWTSTPEAEPAEPPPSEVEAYPAAPMAASEGGMDAAETTAAQAHAVPAGEEAIGESTQCPRCGTENRPGLAFCRNCGQRLVAAGVASTIERPGAPEGTMACPRCGTHNRAGVAFCQNCGANLRAAAPGYVPPALAGEPSAETVVVGRRGAVLGPVVLLIGLVGIVTGYLLPFLYGSGSLLERAVGANGYGVAFWSAYPDVSGLPDQLYYGLAGPIPILGLLVLVLAIAGFVRAAPGPLQTIGLVIALLWSVGLIVLFGVVELAGNWSGDIVGMLRVLTPAGIIFMLSALIVVIGTLTRFGRA